MSVHHRLRLLAFPVRARSGEPLWSGMRSPGSRTRSVRTCQGLRPRWAGPSARSNAPVRIAFRKRNSVGAQDDVDFAAQWLAYAIPCRRFACILTDTCARLGADVVCYSFIAVDLHHLLLAGLPAHSASNPKRSFETSNCRLDQNGTG